MRMRWIAVLVAPLMSACTHSAEPRRPLTATQESAVLVNDLNDPAWPADLITLDSAVVTGEGRLRVFTRFGGGCAEHAAALLVGRAFMESFPPQLRARVAHEANDDACKALLSRTFDFDLQPVREHYRQSYGSGAGSLVLNLGTVSVTYVF